MKREEKLMEELVRQRLLERQKEDEEIAEQQRVRQDKEAAEWQRRQKQDDKARKMCDHLSEKK